jgi:hypothetical protein
LSKQILLFYVFDVKLASADPVRTSFSFYQKDLDALLAHVANLQAAGVKARRASLLRALIHYSTPKQLHDSAAALSKAQQEAGGVREADYIADYPTVDLPPADLEKLDQVVTSLSKEGCLASRVFVVRALVRALPEGTDLSAMMKRFKKDFPDKPRGWAALKLKKEGKGA